AVAVAMIAPFEGFYGHKYHDSVGVLTICYGATAADGVDFSKTYTKGQCLDMLATDIPKYDAPLKRCIKPEVYNALPVHRHAALVSLAYNIGSAGVCHSSVVRDLNAGRVQQACNDFLRFDRAGGRVLQGLVNRRRAERASCLRTD
ncbi:MAG: lysozyme, partial [Acidobacteriaceae bacterium]